MSPSQGEGRGSESLPPLKIAFSLLRTIAMNLVGTDQKTKILEAIKTLSRKLAGSNIKWLIGGTGSLLVHGIDVVPADIDLIVDLKDSNKAKVILEDLIIKDIELEEIPQKTRIKVGDIDGEILAFNINPELLTTVNVDGVDISVHQLQAEYDFYKARTDKIEANRKKIELIEKALQKI
jgi:hypothetical protein